MNMNNVGNASTIDATNNLEKPNNKIIDLKPYRSILNRLKGVFAILSVTALPMYAMADTNQVDNQITAEATAEAQADQILNKNQKEVEANYTLKAHKEMIGIAENMCNKFDQDTSLQENLYSVVACMPKVKLGGDIAAQTLEAPDTLDLTLSQESLKAFKTGNIDVTNLNKSLKGLNNDLLKYEKDLLKLGDQTKFMQDFDKLARPKSELVHDIKRTSLNNNYFWVPSANLKSSHMAKLLK